MKLPDLISTGWTEIRSHKMRSFLSFFAIAIGIATFFYTLSVLSQRYRDIDRAAKISGTGRIDIITEHPLDMTQYYILVDTIKPAKVKCVYSKKKVPRYLPVHVH